MKFLRKKLDALEPLFHPGGKFEKFYSLYEMVDTFVFTPGTVTNSQTHVRDAIDLKRVMITVAVALGPCVFMACYNTGYQANLALQTVSESEGWRLSVMQFLGLATSPTNYISNFVHGFLYFFPVFLVCNIAGGLVETIFATIRGHEINEGFLVTGILFPLTLPPTVPLWQVAIAIMFGVLFGKEIFGGTGKNFLNVALLARAFLYFAYPGDITGDAIWVAADGYTAATPLGQVASEGVSAITVSWKEAFLGFMPGSMGETSVVACLLGAFYLIWTGIGSWKTMAAVTLSFGATIWLFNWAGSSTNPAFALNACWHYVIGGFAFGTVFMATDPVTSAMTETGKWVYGTVIGVMTALVRVVNPAFPEGIMLAILFGNVFAPLIDWFVVHAKIKKRRMRENGI